MRVWIIKAGEPVPFIAAERNDRLLRAGQMALNLKRAGHEVIWWTAQFSHQLKTHRVIETDRVLRPDPEGPECVFLSSCGYRRHIGFSRLRDHAQLARNFHRVAATLPVPDVIVSAWPTIELADAAVAYGKRQGCPVVLDIRDLWPDIIYARLNASLPFKTNGILVPYERMARRAFGGAAGVTGLSQGMVDWGRGRFGGAGSDRVFRQSMPAPAITDEDRREGRVFWRERGVDLSAPKIRAVWSGSLVPETDGETLLDALEALPEETAQAFDFVLCGTGSLGPRIERIAARLPHVHFPGWVDSQRLRVLLETSHIGLLCYLDRFDYQNSIPNKVVDYSAASMRILTNLAGEVPQMFADTDTVIPYASGNRDDLVRVLSDIAAAPERYRVDWPVSRTIFDAKFDAGTVMPAYIDYLRDVAGLTG